MGPTGTPTHLPENETLVLCGGGLGNAVLFSIGRAARERGNKVLYFAGYRKAEDFYKREEIEAAADVVVWAVDVAPTIPAKRPRTSRSSATSCRPCSRMPRAASGRRRSRSARRRVSSRSAPTA